MVHGEERFASANTMLSLVNHTAPLKQTKVHRQTQLPTVQQHLLVLVIEIESDCLVPFPLTIQGNAYGVAYQRRPEQRNVHEPGSIQAVPFFSLSQQPTNLTFYIEVLEIELGRAVEPALPPNLCANVPR